MLAQTIRATNEQETLPSDNECSELSKESVIVGTEGAAEAAGKADGSAVVPVVDAVACALTVQRRPPLVRAMSAPVRLDESSKQNGGGGILGAAQKRSQQKLRRRKIFTRAASSSVASVPPTSAAGCNPLLGTDADGAKKSLSRARSVIAPDVITLVSLLSSEGSDSEREDNSAVSTTPTGDKQSGQGRSPQRRAPLLRKTGKSGKSRAGGRVIRGGREKATGTNCICSLVSRQLPAHVPTGLQGVFAHDTTWLHCTSRCSHSRQSTAHGAACFHIPHRRQG